MSASLACGVLPSLTRLQFKGASKYLEGLISRIDALLNEEELKFCEKTYPMWLALSPTLVCHGQIRRIAHIVDSCCNITPANGKD